MRCEQGREKLWNKNFLLTQGVRTDKTKCYVAAGKELIVKSRIFLSTKLRFAVMASLATLFLLTSAGLSFAQYDQTGPWWAKLPRPLKGMAYTPEPSDFSSTTNCPNPSTCKYFDDDFFNADFEELWGSTGANARNDLATIAGMGMNFLHLYDFSPCRNHAPFIEYANSLGLSVMIPISNYFVSGSDPNEQQDIQTLFNEIYQVGTSNQGTPIAGAVIWDIGNEYDINGISAADVAKVVSIIVGYENSLGITDDNKLLFTSPVSFGTFGMPNAPAIAKLRHLQKAFIAAGLKDVWYNRFVGSINPFNSGTFMAHYLKATYPENMSTKHTTLPLFFSEFGQDAPDACGQLHPNHPHSKCATTAQQNAAQATFETSQIGKVLPIAQSPSDSKTGYFYGFSIFQWQNEFFLSGAQGTWGVVGQGTPPTGDGTIIGGLCGIPPDSYPIDPLNDKPNFAAIVSAIH